MKKKDLFIIVPLLVIATVLFAIYFAMKMQDTTAIRVNIGNNESYEYPLNKDGIYRIETAEGYNIITVMDGAVSVTEADCKNQVCVQSPEIDEAGESIVCLPHKVSITVIK